MEINIPRRPSLEHIFPREGAVEPQFQGPGRSFSTVKLVVHPMFATPGTRVITSLSPGPLNVLRQRSRGSASLLRMGMGRWPKGAPFWSQGHIQLTKRRFGKPQRWLAYFWLAFEANQTGHPHAPSTKDMQALGLISPPSRKRRPTSRRLSSHDRVAEGRPARILGSRSAYLSQNRNLAAAYPKVMKGDGKE